MRRQCFFTLLLSCLSMPQAFATDDFSNLYRYPFYAGIAVGYGTTTWEGLVPSNKNKNVAMTISTPTEVSEGGVVGGIELGYEFNPYFALELNYIRYPNAKVLFDTASLFSFESGLESLNTHTETISLMARIMLRIPSTYTRAYSSAGVSAVHRYDQLKDHWRGSPSFGLGVNRNFSEHIMGEFGGIYTAGYGESQLNPAQSYYPFLYSIFLRLAYRF